MQRVSEGVEEANVVELSKISDIVKEKFVALVEGHFLQRVKPIDQPIIVASHGAEEAGGITKMALDLRFDLPPSIDGMSVNPCRLLVCVANGTSVCVFLTHDEVLPEPL